MQLDILSNSAKFVRCGGYLIYSTCSIFRQENEDVIEQFLSTNTDFEPVPIKQYLSKHGINNLGIGDDDYYLTLYPHVNNTDGFFICRLRRTDLFS